MKKRRDRPTDPDQKKRVLTLALPIQFNCYQYDSIIVCTIREWLLYRVSNTPIFGLLKGRAHFISFGAVGGSWTPAPHHHQNLNRLLKLEFISRDVQTIITAMGICLCDCVHLAVSLIFIHKINDKMIKLWMEIDLAPLTLFAVIIISIYSAFVAFAK